MKRAKLVALASLCAVSAATAQPKAEDQITYRQSAMMLMRWNLGVIKSQTKGPAERYDQARVVAATDAIAAIARLPLDTLFSPQSASGEGRHETRVKPAYFEQPEKVGQRWRDFREAADTLARVARDGEQAETAEALERLFKTCKGCHKPYRRKR